MNQKEFIDKSIIRHHNYYDYSKVNYINNKSKVEIICPEHGSFSKIALNHLRGSGCVKCLYERVSKDYKSNTKDFIQKSILIHGDKYDYSLVNYTMAKNKVEIICKKHGVFTQRASDHLSGRGCLKCSFDNVKLTINKFIERSISKHGLRYDYTKSDYHTIDTKVEIICKDHGSFYQSPAKHMRGQGCPKCGSLISNAAKIKSKDDLFKRFSEIHNDIY